MSKRIIGGGILSLVFLIFVGGTCYTFWHQFGAVGILYGLGVWCFGVLMALAINIGLGLLTEGGSDE